MATACFPERARAGRAAGRVRGTRAAAVAFLLAAWTVPEALQAKEVRGEGRDPAEARRAEEIRLERVRAEIEEIRQRLKGTESKAGSVLDALDELQLKMALLGREAQSLRQQSREAAGREAAARGEAMEVGERIAASERLLKVWLREIYKVGPTRYLRVVAAASSPGEIAAGHRAVEALSLGEGRRVEAFRADRDRLDAALQEIAAERENLARLEDELASRDRELRDTRARKEAVLSGLKREQASQKRALMELAQVEKEVRGLLDSLSGAGRGQKTRSLGFARFRGRLGWPARGKVAVPFGNVRHPRFSTQVPHPGIDIAAPPGQDVRAVFDGRVIFSNWFRGYGQMIVLDHGDGFLSIYGHVDERLVADGQEVRQGDAIALSGEGGSFDTPGLYFEIRHDGKPEDPAQWLRAGAGEVTERRPAATPRGARRSRGAPGRGESQR
jgi:septal ring factor EnvC (AmiA/AmiB activator)